ncbi:hypothetical protein VB834_30150 [Limnoraphis robusta Tam1]|uniref:Uncharacterized protein n=1 Tax=Limnoraphis robusta CCNP1315 TaxID=3110306 RepID=A0ABU5TZX3_9CYAN|nr:hypothetical protein [Limnoraphis robusta]MEA5500323.1 hypothetical protein [Limnoraphis robusta BA-68 BA1]MEA5520460.1 hypothetical protein [Limnoraphis robusta CCNP1315]MEA5543297.1 hypothetical protein [Limnoraphis robusta Tam1]MEA5546606.1 hypothetical protein [Limnoraphis robusta CCNP1324]
MPNRSSIPTPKVDRYLEEKTARTAKLAPSMLNSDLAIIAKQLNNFASQFDAESVEQRQKTVNEIEF